MIRLVHAHVVLRITFDSTIENVDCPNHQLNHFCLLNKNVIIYFKSFSRPKLHSEQINVNDYPFIYTNC